MSGNLHKRPGVSEHLSVTAAQQSILKNHVIMNIILHEL